MPLLTLSLINTNEFNVTFLYFVFLILRDCSQIYQNFTADSMASADTLYGRRGPTV